MRYAWVAGIVVAGIGVLGSAAGADPEPPTIRLPVVVHVAQADGSAIADATQVAAMIDIVNRIYAGSGICFQLKEVRDVARDADLVSYSDRRILKAWVAARAINVFLVRTIKDPSPSESTVRATARVGRKPSGWLRGAEIPAAKKKPSIYLLFTLTAGAPTLAHELGHFLGEGHHKDPLNLMSYGSGRNGFDDKQFENFRRHARRELKTGMLAPAKSCDAP
jgi:hypothetical protein